MKRRATGWGRALVAAAAAWLGGQTASATLVVADFNDLSTGALTNTTGGTGFKADKWTFSGRLQVVAGELDSLYARPQTGALHSVQTVATGLSSDAQTARALATPLTGTIWFSFLAQMTDGGDRVAFSINPGSADNNVRDADFIFVSGQFRVRVGAGSTTMATGLATNGIGANLVLGRIMVNNPAVAGGTNDTLDVWLNPSVTSPNASELPLPGYSTNLNWLSNNAISNIGVVSYDTLAGDGGVIDNIRLSDNGTGLTDVIRVGAPGAGFAAADFNDLTAGTLMNQSGGSGFVATPWCLGDRPKVISGNLTSPLYTLSQTGTALSVQTTNAAATSVAAQAGRVLAVPLSGTIWFSFLAQLTDGDDRVALSINPSSYDGSAGGLDGDFIFVGTGTGGDFRVRRGPALTSVTVASNLVQNGTTVNLVVGKITVNDPQTAGGTNDTVQVWLNPNLIGVSGPSQMPAPSFSNSAMDWISGGAVASIGVISYGASDGGILDNIRISSGFYAFCDVTGAPRPAGSIFRTR